MPGRCVKVTRLFPSAEEAAEKKEFAEVIGVVVGDEEGFAEQRLTGAVGERGEEVGVLLADNPDQGVKSGTEGMDGLVPGCGVGRSGRFWPVAGGKFRGDVLWIARELEDVPLSDAHVFENFPRRVRGAFGANA